MTAVAEADDILHCRLFRNGRRIEALAARLARRSSWGSSVRRPRPVSQILRKVCG